MFEGYAKLTTTSDNMAGVLQALKDLERMDVLVGIPQEKSSRKKGHINNAELIYIHTHGVRSIPMRQEINENVGKGLPYSKAHQMYITAHGSPLWNVPPRPIIEPAIEADRKEISPYLGEAAQAMLEKDPGKAESALKKAGMAAQNFVRAWFTDSRNGWPRNSPETIKAKGSDRPLIDTGELRKSIIWVIRRK